MKKILTGIIAAAMSLAATAQTDVWVWQNGTATKMAAADSITFTEPQAVTPETPTPETPTPETSTHEYVDLGLSVKWATCNVGAEKPEDYGDYFAWGETVPKSDYSWSTYKFTTDGGDTFTKYTGNDKAWLDAADDAAVANWGGTWRMPNHVEQQELIDNCTWEWQEAGNTTFGGVAGYKVTSNVTGYTDKYIFLPAAGGRSGTDVYGAGKWGDYWATMLSSDNPGFAFATHFHSEGEYCPSDYRYYGQSVRPVCK